MKIILFGSTGYLGSRISEYFLKKEYEVKAVKTDVTDIAQVRSALSGVHHAVVINATGKTGSPNVDWCETHRLETTSVNITGAINVATVAAEQGNYVIQMGSGCIFDSSVVPSPCVIPSDPAPKCGGAEESLSSYSFTEDDLPNFFGSFYSVTKGVAELALREIPNVCILRIRMPLSAIPHPKNLLTKLLGYKKIVNVPNSVTVIEDFLPFLDRVIEKRVTGVLNAVNPGVYRHSDLLELYGGHFEYITLEEFEGMTKARRSNCVLSTKKSEVMGIAMPRIEESLERLF